MWDADLPNLSLWDTFAHVPTCKYVATVSLEIGDIFVKTTQFSNYFISFCSPHLNTFDWQWSAIHFLNFYQNIDFLLETLIKKKIKLAVKYVLNTKRKMWVL